MWKFIRYVAYQPLMVVLFIAGAAWCHSLIAGAVLAITIPLTLEFFIGRVEKRRALGRA